MTDTITDESIPWVTTSHRYHRPSWRERLDLWVDVMLVRLYVPKPLRQLVGFWTTLLVEGPYGALDFLAFCFLDDWHVPHRNCRHLENSDV